MAGFKKLNPKAVSTRSKSMTLKLSQKTIQTIGIVAIGKSLASQKPWWITANIGSTTTIFCAVVEDLSQTRILLCWKANTGRSWKSNGEGEESQGAPRQPGEGGEG